MEVVGKNVAARPRWSILDLAEPVRRAGGHRATLACRQVVEDDLEAVSGVVHGDLYIVPRVHQEVLRRISREGGQG